MTYALLKEIKALCGEFSSPRPAVIASIAELVDRGLGGLPPPPPPLAYPFAGGAGASWQPPATPAVCGLILTPAQAVAPKLLDAAIAYECDLTSRFKEYVGLDAAAEDYAHENPLAAELVALRELLEPLRPPKPPTLEEALAVLREVQEYAPGFLIVRDLLARVPK